ncbi:hypothetical protein IFM89_013202 [Coptis chinensis]|uniref:F-box domain-containing protein n=1 Tax=Coptis chinensis TaxID=261450 RepID=A0A835H2Y1_9MAGN|nr:hypothetical protein IFM89_013202 [Coptis chinensis]
MKNRVAKKYKSGRSNTKQQVTERPLPDLPLDIMENIMRRLYYADHVCALAVCKGWRSMYGVPPLQQLPWLMAFKEDSWTSCQLFDPVYKKTHNIYIDDSNKGLLKGKRLKDIDVHVVKMDKTWNTRTFKCGTRLWHAFRNAIYLEAIFYCSSHIGILGTYNVTHQTWSVFPAALPVAHYCSGPYYDIYMVESNGEILKIYTKDEEDGPVWGAPQISIFILCRLNMTWKRMENFDDRVLFVGGCGASLSAAVAGRKSQGKLANRVYTCSGSRTKYFLMQKAVFRDKIAKRSHPCTKFYGSLSTENCKKIWIQHPETGSPPGKDASEL